MTKTRLLIPAAVLVCAILVAASTVTGMTHANRRHSEAPAVRAMVRNGTCQAKEIWFAPASGRVLFLCQTEHDPRLWGGWIVFIAQNNGTELIQPHEATVLVSSEAYWRGVIRRDRYMPMLNFPTILDHATDSLGIATP
jgi:hypothetical protein